MATLATPSRAIQKRVAPLDPTQVRCLLESTKLHRLGPLFHVTVATGFRQGELLGLRWIDVDIDGAVLTVRHALQVRDGAPTLVEPKTARSVRTLSLPASAVKALRSQRAKQNADRLAAGTHWKGDDLGLVFTSTVGTPLNPSNVTHEFQKALEAAGLPRQRFHDLRHCCASLLLAQNVSPRVVMEQLGHSQISLTMNTYSHVMPAALKQAADALDEALA